MTTTNNVTGTLIKVHCKKKMKWGDVSTNYLHCPYW